jgi:predicted small secreted protein
MATFKKNNKVTLVLAAVMIMATLLASSCNARGMGL